MGLKQVSFVEWSSPYISEGPSSEVSLCIYYEGKPVEMKSTEVQTLGELRMRDTANGWGYCHLLAVSR